MSKALNKYKARVEKVNSLLCVGLDSDLKRLPKQFLQHSHPQFKFNQWIIDQTHQSVCAYKPNLAFYEARGANGWESLELTVEYLQQKHPDIFLIADAKRADIGSSNQGYVEAIFDKLKFDAITLHPYLGQEALAPFLCRTDKVSIILCHTSNPGADEFQKLKVQDVPLWLRVAQQVASKWNQAQNCMLVVGATYPEELKQVRTIVGDMPLLVPGVGTQGGNLQLVLKAGLDQNHRGLIINSSRGIIFSRDPSQVTTLLHTRINQTISKL